MLQSSNGIATLTVTVQVLPVWSARGPQLGRGRVRAAAASPPPPGPAAGSRAGAIAAGVRSRPGPAGGRSTRPRPACGSSPPSRPQRDQLVLHGRQQPGHHRMAGQGGVGGHEGQGGGEGRSRHGGDPTSVAQPATGPPNPAGPVRSSGRPNREYLNSYTLTSIVGTVVGWAGVKALRHSGTVDSVQPVIISAVVITVIWSGIGPLCETPSDASCWLGALGSW